MSSYPLDHKPINGLLAEATKLQVRPEDVCKKSIFPVSVSHVTDSGNCWVYISFIISVICDVVNKFSKITLRSLIPETLLKPPNSCMSATVIPGKCVPPNVGSNDASNSEAAVL